jgi:D-glycero-beta-D-manno-heptose 1-phosphate adenylyltransferase
MISGVYDINALLQLVKQWKSEGQKIVFTNGVFDIVHMGHVDYLQKAKAEGDRLIVGINSDASVRRLNKGPERPINQEIPRAFIIGALRSVDATIVFGEDTPHALITSIMPDVLAKGGDYNPEEVDPNSKAFIVGSVEVKANGGRVVAIPFVDGFSTTSIVQKMKGN